MVRILKSEIFISLMQAVLLASLFETFFGRNHVNSTVVYVAMLLSSIGLFAGLSVAAVVRWRK